MSFVWPWVLVALLGLPVCVLLYVRLQRQRDATAARLGAMGVAPGGAALAGRRRHIPPVILLIGVVLMVVASARPEVTLPLPRMEGTVLLAMDVSASMAADDVKPNRMEAARIAAKTLVERRPDDTVMGVVAFGEGGLIVQPPTDDNEALNATLDRLTPQSGTSLGQGLLTALNLASPEAGRGAEGAEARGAFAPAIIVMITDGENTDPPDPAEVAQMAIERGVRVYTVGIGSLEGATIEVEGFSLYTQLNEPVLEVIALLTEGEYFRLGEQDDISSVYEELETEFVVESRKVEIAPVLGGISALLLLAGGALSLIWFGRAP